MQVPTLPKRFDDCILTSSSPFCPAANTIAARPIGEPWRRNALGAPGQLQLTPAIEGGADRGGLGLDDDGQDGNLGVRVFPSPIACRVLRSQIASFRCSIGAGPTEPAYERARLGLWAFGGVRVFIDISIMPLFCPQTTIALTACTTFSMLPGDG